MCEVLLVAVIVQLEFKISEAFPTQQGTHFGGDLITEYCDKIKNLTKKKKKKYNTYISIGLHSHVFQ